jgi:hypothetical protein
VHAAVGWWALFVFVGLGLLLESLHAFKAGWYLDVSNGARRLMWTLAHAHGALAGLVNLAFAGSADRLAEHAPRRAAVASASLIAATVLLPGGFLLGGIWIEDGDPGLGVLLVPVGGALLALATLLRALAPRG